MGSDKQYSEEEREAEEIFENCEEQIMASKGDDELGLGTSEEMMREIELLQLQEKRMRKLVDQRKEERKQLELENSRMQRQKKYMEEMARRMRTMRLSINDRWNPQDHLLELVTC
eukprot:TRINITY_DN20674_c0_g1_i1.p2 TRINITY_DN20674_c0_g1~~TRINITY_DN20674_c0_g1_i1.p2  ORF type:complete len:115 (-),score=49.81 TRINITY_DN20674_c0_g1_i1:380-724(-)